MRTDIFVVYNMFVICSLFNLFVFKDNCEINISIYIHIQFLRNVLHHVMESYDSINGVINSIDYI